jgi:hypothetical protein
LHDVLPVDQGLRPETIRRHVLETAERLEAKLGPEEFAYDIAMVIGARLH